jgi:hypothetical protein
VSIAPVTLARGLKASVLHRWVKEAERGKNPIAIHPTIPGVAIGSGEDFVPVAMPAHPAEGTIRIRCAAVGAR